MSVVKDLQPTPDWLSAEMPPGYQNRVTEIERLTRELRDLERFGRLLYATGPDLAESTADAFAALKFQTEPLAQFGEGALVVKLDDRHRLLVHVSAAGGVIQKKDEALGQVFQLLHTVAEESDRVVLVANSDPATRPADRADALGPEARNLLQRLGVNFVGPPTLFALWMLAMQDMARARGYVEKLHAQDGGVFQLPASATR